MSDPTEPIETRRNVHFKEAVLVVQGVTLDGQEIMVTINKFQVTNLDLTVYMDVDVITSGGNAPIAETRSPNIRLEMDGPVKGDMGTSFLTIQKVDGPAEGDGRDG